MFDERGRRSDGVCDLEQELRRAPPGGSAGEAQATEVVNEPPDVLVRGAEDLVPAGVGRDPAVRLGDRYTRVVESTELTVEPRIEPRREGEPWNAPGVEERKPVDHPPSLPCRTTRRVPVLCRTSL